MTITRQRKEIPPYGNLTDQEIRNIVNETRRGKTNNGGRITLTANSATTTINDPLITTNSVLHFTPKTANAKTEGIPYYDEEADLTPGQCVIHHTNNAQTDRHYLLTVNC